MRVRSSVVIALALGSACGPKPTPPPVELRPSGPELPDPPPVDPQARGAAYLTTLAATLQPAWHQFLEDCRLRLPATHPLNQPGLVAIAELAIARDGRVLPRIVTSSGNGDYDTAVFDLVSDAAPVAAPPAELASDDELVHVHWLFARDSRQAGPATAKVVDVPLPLFDVVELLVGRGAIAKAAGRIAAARPDDPDRARAIDRLMLAALREGLASPNGAVRRAAADAIGRAKVATLAEDVRTLAGPIPDQDLRVVAIAAAAQLGDPAAVPVLARDLADDLANRPRIALAKITALAGLGRAAEATPAITAALQPAPTPTALAALALAPIPELAPKLPRWLVDDDARIRAAVCNALPAAAPPLAPRLIVRGMADGDATVRAACIRAAGRWRPGVERDAAAMRRLRELARDRDRTVRAWAIGVLGLVEPGHKLRALADPASEVRAASVNGASEADLRTLAGDRAPEVRAAALLALGDRAAELAVTASADLSAAVRKAAATVTTSDDVLERLARDDSPDVATAALVRLVGRRGRAAMAGPLLATLAASPAHGEVRVRIALAWLLAR